MLCIFPTWAASVIRTTLTSHKDRFARNYRDDDTESDSPSESHQIFPHSWTVCGWLLCAESLSDPSAGSSTSPPHNTAIWYIPVHIIDIPRAGNNDLSTPSKSAWNFENYTRIGYDHDIKTYIPIHIHCVHLIPWNYRNTLDNSSSSQHTNAALGSVQLRAKLLLQ